MRAAVQQKTKEDPSYLIAIQRKLDAFMKEAAPVDARLQEMAKKYGFEINKVGPAY
jgi:hypothetical protein